MNKNILWTDVETTGLDAEKNGIIQLAAIIDIDGEFVAEKEFKMFPTGRMFEDSALKVNGHDKFDILSYPEWGIIATEFIDFIREYRVSVSFSFGGHNIPFDRRFVKSWLMSFGKLASFNAMVYPSGLDIDTLKIARNDMFLKSLPSKKLEECCKALGIDSAGSHDALNDIRMTRSLFWTLQKKNGAKNAK